MKNKQKVVLAVENHPMVDHVNFSLDNLSESNFTAILVFYKKDEESPNIMCGVARLKKQKKGSKCRINKPHNWKMDKNDHSLEDMIYYGYYIVSWAGIKDK